MPKQAQRSRSVLEDGSRFLGLFWKEKSPSYNRSNTVEISECGEIYRIRQYVSSDWNNTGYFGSLASCLYFVNVPFV